MGISAKPIGKMESLLKKIDNENEEKKQELKRAKKAPKKKGTNKDSN